MEGHDEGRMALSEYAFQEQGQGVMWRAGFRDPNDIFGNYGSQLLVGDDRSIFAIVGEKVIKLDQAGSVQWSAYVHVPQGFSLMENGDVLVTGGLSLTILDQRTGAQTWAYSSESYLPMFDWSICLEDGSILFTETYNWNEGLSYEYRLTKLSPEKEREWAINLGEDALSPAAVGPDGTIYIGNYHLYALSPGGEILWNGTGAGAFNNHPIPMIHPEIGVIFPTRYSLSALTYDGDTIWDFFLNGSIEACAIDGNGNILVSLIPENQGLEGQDAPCLLCLSPSGELIWRYNLPDQPSTGITCSANDLIFVPTTTTLVVLDLNGTMIWQHKFLGLLFATPVLSENGTLYLLVSQDASNPFLKPYTNLYAIQGEVRPDFPFVLVLSIFLIFVAFIAIMYWIERRGNKK
ncbi:MAG: PQQ-binding-like beta-propeller repeat protein [Methanomassiliicoccales archaeon]|jgi:outer membrane protein assembly factor BamB|nr:PQQ-binding-like beta-propeller repeat protein [Methanomassiliicoccales archaeon]